MGKSRPATLKKGNDTKILIIGGTGTISTAITRQLAACNHELWLLNRGNGSDELPQNVHLVTGDINNHTDEVVAKLAGSSRLYYDTKGPLV